MDYRSFSSPTFFTCTFFLLCSYDYRNSEKVNPEKTEHQDQYDIIIVPGVPYQQPSFAIVLKSRILWAKYLFEQKIAKNIIFSGSSVHTPYIEGKIMRIYADSLGISSVNTFSEIKAEHSTENVIYSLQLAKKMGFKRIAVATDPYQAIMLKNFIKRKCPEVEVITIEYNKIHLKTSPWPDIDASSAYVNNFVPLGDRENCLKRFTGTMGRHIKKNACGADQEKAPVYVTF
ncbi:MAG: YdcF family protein [Bacteroidetes bacterium]|nr:YdcF family protein [Bacteroidota bacterium]